MTLYVLEVVTLSADAPPVENRHGLWQSESYDDVREFGERYRKYTPYRVEVCAYEKGRRIAAEAVWP